jgi:hypothetical protein
MERSNIGRKYISVWYEPYSTRYDVRESNNKPISYLIPSQTFAIVSLAPISNASVIRRFIS